MEKKRIIKQLHLAYKNNSNLTKEQKEALLEAIKIIKAKGEFDPAWIAVILQALGLGIDIFQRGP